MMNQCGRGWAVVGLAVLAGTLLCAAPVIGVATTRGVMEVDNAVVRGKAAVSEGSSVRTKDMVGHVELHNGVRVMLAKATAAEVHGNRVVLSSGAGQVTTRPDFELDVLGFRISTERPNAVARVTYERADRILVTPVDAPVKVSRDGVLVARLAPGNTYYFEPPGSGEPRTGTPENKSTVKRALSTKAKWGIALGATAAAAGAGLGVALSTDEGTPVSGR